MAKRIVCLAELLIGVFFLIPRFCLYANIAALIALSFFVCLTGDNYLNPSIIGPIESCGCFGELIHFTPLEAFVKSCVLWVFALGGIIMYKSNRHNTTTDFDNIMK